MIASRRYREARIKERYWDQEPHAIVMKDHRLAGLWERWKDSATPRNSVRRRPPEDGHRHTSAGQDFCGYPQKPNDLHPQLATLH